MNSPHKGQWRGALIFSLVCAWRKACANNRDAGGLRHHRAHSDATVINQQQIYRNVESLSMWRRHHAVPDRHVCRCSSSVIAPQMADKATIYSTVCSMKRKQNRHITGPVRCESNDPHGFPSQRASNAEYISISRCLHARPWPGMMECSSIDFSCVHTFTQLPMFSKHVFLSVCILHCFSI